MKAKISAQAQTVLDILAAKRCHLTADEILEGLDGIGTATVYRALDHLTEMGLIRRLSLGKKSAVYEYIRTNHMHFVCEQCGRRVRYRGGFYRHGGGSRKMLRAPRQLVRGNGSRRLQGLPEQAKGVNRRGLSV